MLKKDADRLKMAAKKQQALQQSMLSTAENGYKPTEALVPSAPFYPKAFSCPFIWGTALLVLAVFLI